MKLTEMESKTLNAVAHHLYNPLNGGTPTTVEDSQTWCFVDDFAQTTGYTVNQTKGILSSLSKKDLVIIDDNSHIDDDNTIQLTELGLKYL